MPSRTQAAVLPVASEITPALTSTEGRKVRPSETRGSQRTFAIAGSTTASSALVWARSSRVAMDVEASRQTVNQTENPRSAGNLLPAEASPLSISSSSVRVSSSTGRVSVYLAGLKTKASTEVSFRESPPKSHTPTHAAPLDKSAFVSRTVAFRESDQVNASTRHESSHGTMSSAPTLQSMQSRGGYLKNTTRKISASIDKQESLARLPLSASQWIHDEITIAGNLFKPSKDQKYAYPEGSQATLHEVVPGKSLPPIQYESTAMKEHTMSPSISSRALHTPQGQTKEWPSVKSSGSLTRDTSLEFTTSVAAQEPSTLSREVGGQAKQTRVSSPEATRSQEHMSLHRSAAPSQEPAPKSVMRSGEGRVVTESRMSPSLLRHTGIKFPVGTPTEDGFAMSTTIRGSPTDPTDQQTVQSARRVEIADLLTSPISTLATGPDISTQVRERDLAENTVGVVQLSEQASHPFNAFRSEHVSTQNLKSSIGKERPHSQTHATHPVLSRAVERGVPSSAGSVRPGSTRVLGSAIQNERLRYQSHATPMDGLLTRSSAGLWQEASSQSGLSSSHGGQIEYPWNLTASEKSLNQFWTTTPMQAHGQERSAIQTDGARVVSIVQYTEHTGEQLGMQTKEPSERTKTLPSSQMRFASIPRIATPGVPPVSYTTSTMLLADRISRATTLAPFTDRKGFSVTNVSVLEPRGQEFSSGRANNSSSTTQAHTSTVMQPETIEAVETISIPRGNEETVGYNRHSLTPEPVSTYQLSRGVAASIDPEMYFDVFSWKPFPVSRTATDILAFEPATLQATPKNNRERVQQPSTQNDFLSDGRQPTMGNRATVTRSELHVILTPLKPQMSPVYTDRMVPSEPLDGSQIHRTTTKDSKTSKRYEITSSSILVSRGELLIAPTKRADNLMDSGLGVITTSVEQQQSSLLMSEKHARVTSSGVFDSEVLPVSQMDDSLSASIGATKSNIQGQASSNQNPAAFPEPSVGLPVSLWRSDETRSTTMDKANIFQTYQVPARTSVTEAQDRIVRASIVTSFINGMSSMLLPGTKSGSMRRFPGKSSTPTAVESVSVAPKDSTFKNVLISVRASAAVNTSYTSGMLEESPSLPNTQPAGVSAPSARIQPSRSVTGRTTIRTQGKLLTTQTPTQAVFVDGTRTISSPRDVRVSGRPTPELADKTRDIAVTSATMSSLSLTIPVNSSSSRTWVPAATAVRLDDFSELVSAIHESANSHAFAAVPRKTQSAMSPQGLSNANMMNRSKDHTDKESANVVSSSLLCPRVENSTVTLEQQSAAKSIVSSHGILGMVASSAVASTLLSGSSSMEQKFSPTKADHTSVVLKPSVVPVGHGKEPNTEMSHSSVQDIITATSPSRPTQHSECASSSFVVPSTSAQLKRADSQFGSLTKTPGPHPSAQSSRVILEGEILQTDGGKHSMIEESGARASKYAHPTARSTSDTASRSAAGSHFGSSSRLDSGSYVSSSPSVEKGVSEGAFINTTIPLRMSVPVAESQHLIKSRIPQVPAKRSTEATLHSSSRVLNSEHPAISVSSVSSPSSERSFQNPITRLSSVVASPAGRSSSFKQHLQHSTMYTKLSVFPVTEGFQVSPTSHIGSTEARRGSVVGGNSMGTSYSSFNANDSLLPITPGHGPSIPRNGKSPQYVSGGLSSSFSFTPATVTAAVTSKMMSSNSTVSADQTSSVYKDVRKEEGENRNSSGVSKMKIWSPVNASCDAILVGVSFIERGIVSTSRRL